VPIAVQVTIDDGLQGGAGVDLDPAVLTAVSLAAIAVLVTASARVAG
jgi:hypothetical protein